MRGNGRIVEYMGQTDRQTDRDQVRYGMHLADRKRREKNSLKIQNVKQFGNPSRTNVKINERMFENVSKQRNKNMWKFKM